MTISFARDVVSVHIAKTANVRSQSSHVSIDISTGSG